ncbi:cupin domain-containing protein [Undibacterium cyanobacteriorum]|uniref:Cupin domain-containing protein n=1 Tax=Undibacterium cyanobacteriorum TaxID=3073561 RepID=A0ABY9RFT3_9BURK|nr:cupin domain-containing protein [Undibacterium sp. 20NA77.5]WMW80092.1 cupin domain-containing protein [Undibacterium sp. 20NA77.5]
MSDHPATLTALIATDVAPRAKKSIYPEPFASRMEGREKRILGDLFGLTNFGVNLTTLAPNAVSALRHCHTHQDEFIYIVQGRPSLVTNEGKTQLAPGMCAGFKAGTGNAHCLLNETDEVVLYLEVGDRTPNDEVAYPDEDLKAVFHNGGWMFLHKDGSSY